MNRFQTTNILPFDGEVYYLPGFLPLAEQLKALQALEKEIGWTSDSVKMYGKTIQTSRKMAWYGEKGLSYTYSGIERKAMPWQQDLLVIKEKIEQLVEHRFNSCLLNRYADGSEGMGWHSDDEPMLGNPNTIASVSLGAERKFCFRHKKTKDKIELYLASGSLLLMTGFTQKNWQHTLPKSLRMKGLRINLTYRAILGS